MVIVTVATIQGCSGGSHCCSVAGAVSAIAAITRTAAPQALVFLHMTALPLAKPKTGIQERENRRLSLLRGPEQNQSVHCPCKARLVFEPMAELALKNNNNVGRMVVAHPFNPNAWQAKTGRSL